MTLPIHSPDELIAAVPHLLKASEPIVFVSLRPKLPTARIDFPATAADRDLAWNSIGGAFSRHARPGASLAIVCLTSDRAYADPVSREFAVRLAKIGTDTPVRLWADGAQWCELGSGQAGL